MTSLEDDFEYYLVLFIQAFDAFRGYLGEVDDNIQNHRYKTKVKVSSINSPVII